MSSQSSTSPKVPTAVYLLGVGIFCLATSEFMIAGLLPQIAPDLGTSVPGAALLITAFAVGMIIGAPIMAVATLGLPRKTVLICVSILFAAVHLVVFLTDNFAIIAVSRVVAAVACGAFWAVGAVLAVKLSPSSMTGRALAIMAAGLTLANVAGVPIGTWIGQLFGWRSAFLAVTIATISSIIAIAAFVPDIRSDRPSARRRALIRPEIGVFRNSQVWLTLSITALFQGAMFCAFTYFAPLITDEAGYGQSAIPIILAAFGIGSFIGISLGGRMADRNIFATIYIGLGSMAVSLVAVALLSGSQVGLALSITAVGITGYVVAPALNARIFAIAGGAPTLASAVNTSAFNVGNAAGPALGAVVVTAAGYRSSAYLAVAVVLIALLVTAIADRTRSTTINASIATQSVSS